MFSYPPLLRWATENKCKATVFDQCMTGLEAMKSTQLLGTPNVQTQLADEFGGLKCNHTSHGSFLGKTSGLQQYTSDMCGRLASVFANQGGGARETRVVEVEPADLLSKGTIEASQFDYLKSHAESAAKCKASGATSCAPSP